MQQDKLEPGDVVHLNSHPNRPMTVRGGSDGSITVQWFDSAGELRNAELPRPMLTKTSPTVAGE
jgi:uncharacterized protein YodC (DUF2158 family)